MRAPYEPDHPFLTDRGPAVAPWTLTDAPATRKELAVPRPARLALSAAAVLTLAVGLVTVGGALGAPEDPVTPTTSRDPGLAVRPDPLTALQQDTERVPRDPERWSALGLAYVQQARLTADPSWYDRAEQALERSLELRPQQNSPALTGQAALASGRHQFQDALTLIEESLSFNDFSSTAYGVKVDALTELGRYDDALAAAERMEQLRPGADSYARLSYAYELRGDLRTARVALERARDIAQPGPDTAFAELYLGELALAQGDLDAADRAYAAALDDDPDQVAARAGQARVLAARGLTDAALAAYREVTDRLPQPSYLVQRGELLESLGRTAEAEEQYAVVRVLQQSFADSGSDVDAELALFEADHGDPATALRLAAAAYEDRPETITVQEAYAWSLHASGRDAEALPIAQAALRLGTRTPELVARVGLVEAAAGHPGAVDHLTQALESPALSPLLAERARTVLAGLS